MACVVVYEARQGQGGGVAEALRAGPWPVVACTERRELIEELLSQPAGAVVFVLSVDASPDVALLQLVRRVALDVPLVIVAAEASLAVRQALQELNPIYCAVQPVETAELCDAVRAALASAH